MSRIKNKIAPLLGTFFDFVPFQKIMGRVEIPFLPFYHVVGEMEELPHISNLYIARTQKQFEEDLDFFLQYFEPISLEEMICFDKKNKKPVFHLSFDDGLRQVYDITLPILEKKGIPATIFFNTNFIDNKELFFRYKVSLLIEKIKLKEISEIEINELGIHPENLLNINDIHHPIFEPFQALFDEFLKSYQPYMNSRQINDLIDRGFTIGAHSENHPHYSNLTLPQQIKQTKNSIDFLVQKFNLNYRAFSFPFTDYNIQHQFFNRIKKNKMADIVFGCAGLKKEKADFHWQRVAMEGTEKNAEKILREEYLYSYFSKFLGQQTVARK